ncbi:hypothetical protein HK104_006675, partial [Borealophlyctis nickersoniae]
NPSLSMSSFDTHQPLSPRKRITLSRSHLPVYTTADATSRSVVSQPLTCQGQCVAVESVADADMDMMDVEDTPPAAAVEVKPCGGSGVATGRMRWDGAGYVQRAVYVFRRVV